MKKTKIKEIAKWTLRNQANVEQNNAESVIRQILKNCGVLLPSGNVPEILRTLSEGDYMFWEDCTYEQARESADAGQPVLGIDGDTMVLLVAADEDEVGAEGTNSFVRDTASLSGQDASGMKFFVASAGTTTTTAPEKGLIVEGIPKRNLLVGETMELCAYMEDDPFGSDKVSWEYDKTVFDMTTQFKYHQTYICLTAKKATKTTTVKAKLLSHSHSFGVRVISMPCCPMWKAHQTKSDCYKKGQSIGTVKGIVVHSTGADNPNVKRYVDFPEMLGENQGGNHWNQSGISKMVHAFIGLDKNQEVCIVNTLPYTYACWGVGQGAKGSYNYSPNGHIQFEICEDALNDEAYFNDAVWEAAVQFCAYLCTIHNLPVDSIVSHKEAHALGYGSNHGDPENWLTKFNKTMDDFRQKVRELLFR